MDTQNLTTSPDKTPERWLPIADFPGYDVSDQGRVRSYWRTVSRGIGNGTGKKNVMAPNPQKILNPDINPGGYPTVRLYIEGKGRTRFCIHKLVLETFIGPCPPGMEACHNNGKRPDNRPSNLRWDTRKNNHWDRWEHGTDPTGTRNGRTKLVPEQVLEIRELSKQGLCPHAIAKVFDLNAKTISDVVTRKHWRHI